MVAQHERNHAFGLAIIAIALLMSGCATGRTAAPLGDPELAAIRSASLEYSAAWLSGDPDRVRAVFTQDAVLLPSGGMTPVEGLPAINEFFWPADTPPMQVTTFDMKPSEVSGTGSLGHVRGTMTLTFKSRSKSAVETYTTEGTYLMILRRASDGRWLIARYMWSHPPWKVVASEPVPADS